jgi:hypothetical protein
MLNGWHGFFTGKWIAGYLRIATVLLWIIISYCKPKHGPLVTYFMQTVFMVNYYISFETYQKDDGRQVEY